MIGCLLRNGVVDSAPKAELGANPEGGGQLVRQTTTAWRSPPGRELSPSFKIVVRISVMVVSRSSTTLSIRSRTRSRSGRRAAACRAIPTANKR